MRTFHIILLLCIFCLAPVCTRPRLRKKQNHREKLGRKVKNRKYHLCLSDDKKVSPKNVCDGIFHCSDLSDEYLCRLPEKMSARETEAGFKILENLIFQNSNNATNPYRDLLTFMRRKQADYVSESAIDISHRACIPGLRSVRNQNVLDPCLFCQPGQILCSKEPVANITQTNLMLGTSYKMCVEKHEICDRKVQCIRAEDEAFCGMRAAPNLVRRNHTDDIFIGSGDSPVQFQQDTVSNITEALALIPKKLPRKKLRKNIFRRMSRSKFSPNLTCGMITEIFSLLKQLPENLRKREGNSKRVFDTPGEYFGLPFEFRDLRHLGPLPLTGRDRNHGQPDLGSPSPPFDPIFNTFSNNFKAMQSLNNVTVLTFNQICDGSIECPSKVDELMCPGCFYCESGSPMYISESSVLDGEADCEDGSDEWPQNNRKSTLASKDKMVKDWPLLLVMWIVGIVAIVGNGIVITRAILTLCVNTKSKIFGGFLARIMKSRSAKRENVGEELESNRSNRSHVSSPSLGLLGRKRMIELWNGGLVLNLAFSDFLMGIYLISLGGVSATQYQRYWTFDNKWRTSVGCQCLGFIVTLSSQASVFFLLALTTLRLFTVVKPFSQTWLKSRYLLIVCATIWLLSATLASMPLLPYIKYYYVTNAWVPFPHFKPPVINKSVADILVIRLADLSNIPNSSGSIGVKSLLWQDMIEYTQSAAPAFADWKLFGYYGAHSVCIPKLYVTTNDVAWQHTAVFLGVNFIAVMYICVAYCIIYFKSTSARKVGFRDNIGKANSLEYSPKSDGDRSKDSHRRRSIYRIVFCLRNLCRSEEASTNASRKANIAKTGEMINLAENKSKSNELQSIQFRIALLVATDCLCWLPICIMGFLKLADFEIQDTAYAVSAVGLLPINSALNPLLYSRFVHGVGKKAWKVLKKQLCTGFCCTRKK